MTQSSPGTDRVTAPCQPSEFPAGVASLRLPLLELMLDPGRTTIMLRLIDLKENLMTHCIVHDPPGADYDTRPYEVPPSQEELIEDLVSHLHAALTEQHCAVEWCSYCYEEHQIRWHQLGIEEVNLEDQHADRIVEESCECDQNPMIVRAKIRYEISGVCPMCGGDEGRHLFGCPFSPKSWSTHAALEYLREPIEPHYLEDGS